MGLVFVPLLGILRVWVRKILCFVQTRDLLTWPRGGLWATHQKAGFLLKY